jgi:hypothetical protein
MIEKIQTKLIYLALLILMVLLISACGASEATPVKVDFPTNGAPIYKVTQSTGLYNAPDTDADLIAELSVGTLLKPADNEKFYDCESFVDSGTTYTLCNVEVVDTGKSGWVLQKWIERQ